MLICIFNGPFLLCFQCLFPGREAQGRLSLHGQHCLCACGAPSRRQLQPPHVREARRDSCLAMSCAPIAALWENFPRGQCPWWSLLTDTSPFICYPLNASRHLGLGATAFIWEGPPYNIAMSPSTTTGEAQGSACALWQGRSQGWADTPSWGAIRGSWKWKFVTLLQPESQDDISLLSPGRRDFGPLGDKWFMLGVEPECTGTKWHKRSSSPIAKAPSKAGKEGDLISLPIPFSPVPSSKSPLFAEELGRQQWESRGEKNSRRKLQAQ